MRSAIFWGCGRNSSKRPLDDAKAYRRRNARSLQSAARERILVLDGAMGTMIQQHKFGEPNFAASASPIGRAICAATTIF